VSLANDLKRLVDLEDSAQDPALVESVASQVGGGSSDLSSATGTLAIAHGGTGAVGLSGDGVLITNSAGTAVGTATTGTTGLPIIAGTSGASPAFGALNLAGSGVTGVLPTGNIATTLTSKRITPRVTTITSSATPTINTDNCDFVDITALAADITSMTTNLSGTPTNGQKLAIRYKASGANHTVTHGASFEACGASLSLTITDGKRTTAIYIYDTTTAKWGLVSVANET